MQFKKLFSSVEFGPMKSSNAAVLAPMTTYSSLPDGTIDPLELDYLERRASGGFGVVMTAACYVHAHGKAFVGQWGCDDDRHLESLASAAEAIHRGGSKAVLQIHHGGRACRRVLSGRVLSASAVPFEREGAEVPEEMTEGEIETAIQSFADAARRAEQTGYDGVEIHGANTYLLQQFVSPLTNLRSDVYGQNRLLFSQQIIERVLGSVSEEFAVGYRFSPEEIEPNGIAWEHTAGLVEMLCQYPLAWAHVSLRNHDQSSFREDFSEPIRERLIQAIQGRMPLIGVGGVWTKEQAEGALQDGYDAIAVGRSAILNPEWGTCEEYRSHYPALNGDIELTVPKGLHEKILGVAGWFPVAEAATSP